MSTTFEEVNKLWEHNREMFPTPARKIVFTNQGGFVRARFEGEAMSTIGASRKEATRRLQFWGGQ